MYRPATPEDIENLTALFWETVLSNTTYISHSEIQTGIARDSGVLADDGKEKWAGYISDKVGGAKSTVFVHSDGGAVDGFIVVEIAGAGDRPFGIVSDLLVSPATRGQGVGSRLLDMGFGWLRENGAAAVYLESGVDNHPAHAFFEKKGFRITSHIFKLREAE